MSGHATARSTGDAHAAPVYFPDAHGFHISKAYMGPSYTSYSVTGNQIPGLDTLFQKSAPSAEYDSKDRSFDTPRCDEDTRVGLIEEIVGWSQSQDHEEPSKLLCMTGSAGSGKSALAQTIAETCAKKGTLAASFFFSVSDPQRNNPDHFVASIAYQLAQATETLQPYIARAVETTRSVFEKSLNRQLEILLVEPIRDALRVDPSYTLDPVLIVVDGLDECKGEEAQAQILNVLYRCSKELAFRVFLTSRPEYAIRNALSADGLFSSGVVYSIILNDYDATEDVRRFFERRLRAIARAHNLDEEKWPLREVIDCLVYYADGLFIYAATVVKFVGERRRCPIQRTQLIINKASLFLGHKRGQNPFEMLDSLYSNILDLAQTSYDSLGYREDEPHTARFLHRLHTLNHMSRIGFLGTLSSSIPEDAEAYLGWESGEVGRVLEDLHSVVKLEIHIARDPFVEDGQGEARAVFSFRHKSFFDFLSSAERSGKYHVPNHLIFVHLAILALHHISTATEEECFWELQHSRYRSGIGPLNTSLSHLNNFLVGSVQFATDFRASGKAYKPLQESLDTFATSQSWHKLTQAYKRAGDSERELLNFFLMEPEPPEPALNEWTTLTRISGGANLKIWAEVLPAQYSEYQQAQRRLEYFNLKLAFQKYLEEVGDGILE